MFYFDELLTRSGLDPRSVRIRLLRHDDRGLAAWRTGGKLRFGCFASFQGGARSPYRDAEVGCHFIIGPTLANGDATALFVGATRILDRWAWDGGRLPVLRDDTIIETERGRQGVEAFDLEWLDTFEPYTERILIRWRGPIAWSQWAHRGEREILELRIDAREPAFPGFSAFSERVANLAFIPQAWRAALGSVRGVYLLVAGDGSQYVGSAAGQDGFMGRWDAYAANGHGGNVILRQRGDRDYAVSILEIASPDMSRDEIIAREVFWKQKLGARAHGLNAN